MTAGATVIGPRADKERIPLIDQAVGDGDTFKFGDVEVCNKELC